MFGQVPEETLPRKMRSIVRIFFGSKAGEDRAAPAYLRKHGADPDGVTDEGDATNAEVEDLRPGMYDLKSSVT